MTFLVCAIAGGDSPCQVDPPARAPTAGGRMGRLPLCFVANRGQFDPAVRFSVHGSSKNVFFTPTGVTFALRDRGQTGRAWAARMGFVDAATDAEVAVVQPGRAVFSYFKGRPDEWKSGVATARQIVYRRLWPGIDLVYSGAESRLKYEFRVAPGADPARIRLRYEGITGLEVAVSGALRVRTPVETFEDAAPVAWQVIDGERIEVPVRFALESGGVSGSRGFSFRVAGYDRNHALIVDPAVLVYCGYIGGSAEDRGYGIDVDAAGNAYVAGWTRSTELTFPAVVGPFVAHSGGADAFVAKVDPTGLELLYCGFIGGSGDDEAYDVCVDASGAAYVTGGATSDEKSFPVKGPLSPKKTGIGYDAFVAKVAPSGTALVYCGYIGGGLDDYGFGIDVDSSGQAHVAGWAYSSPAAGFPVKTGPFTSFGGLSDAFVAKIDSAGTAFVYCGYIGGSSYDYCTGIKIDASGAAVVTGYAASSHATFPVKGGPDLTANGGYDSFVARVPVSGAGLTTCGFIGGAGGDHAFDIDLDASGAIYVTGYTDSTESTFPVKVGPDTTFNGGSADAFVVKLTPSGTALVYCGYVGGVGADRGRGIGVDASGRAVITGETESPDFPTTRGPDSTFNGYTDGFVTMVDKDGASLVYSGYLGGDKPDFAADVVCAPSGKAYVSGYTYSPETTFPVIDGPDLTFNGGTYDAFVALVEDTDFHADKHVVELKLGGMQKLTVDAGVGLAGQPYIIAGSVTGTVPGFDLFGVHVPLNLDRYTDITIAFGGTSPFVGYRGVLDTGGRAAAALVVPVVTGVSKLRLDHAYVVANANGRLLHGSKPVYVILR
ncbi:MAG: SBBP repeat-containing protein [Planctomycetes bacterium]|nr:SBBP repeat-containing protein [Planctomycetota bacterium]MCB9889102.1 SBBP repeat-containing protein [Planctomycetota bacterium]